MKNILLVIVVLVALGCGAYLGLIKPALAPSKDVELVERALLTPDVVVVAHANIRQAVFLERWFIGSPIFPPENAAHATEEEKRSPLGGLRAAGVDLRRDVYDVLYGLYPTDGEQLRQAIAVLGRFDQAAIGQYLGRQPGAVRRDAPGRVSYEIERSDPDTCGAATKWVGTADPRWILIAHAASEASILARLTDAPAEAGELAWWHPLAYDDVLAVGLRDPDTLGSATPQPFL